MASQVDNEPKVGQMTLFMMTMAQNVARKLNRADKLIEYP
jgi:hypothetical protein